MGCRLLIRLLLWRLSCPVNKHITSLHFIFHRLTAVLSLDKIKELGPKILMLCGIILDKRPF